MSFTLGLRTLLLLALVAGATLVLSCPGLRAGDPLLKTGVAFARG